MSQTNFSIFYSWQSDSPAASNRNAIANALKKARVALEARTKGTIIIDEATREAPGSPNIPQTILDKIRQSDAFVCDITTINKPAPAGRPTPNPNVVFELGYAVAQLGWGRIILLFNREYGDFPDDMPFDFDRHRASPYRLAATKPSDKTEHAALTRLLEIAIGTIIRIQPPRPSARASSAEELRRQRDVANIKWLMEQVSITALDEMIAALPQFQVSKIFHFWESFSAVHESSLFHIHDAKLRKALVAMHGAWDGCVSNGDFYRPTSNPEKYIFETPRDNDSRRRLDRVRKRIEASRLLLQKTLRAVLSNLRDKYVEIDIEKCSAVAWKNYVDAQR